MKIQRQELIRGLIALILGTTIFLTACSTVWLGEAEKIVAALIPAAANVVALVAALEGKGVSTADLQTIQSAGAQAGADLQLIQSLIGQYQKADAATKPAILNKIQIAVNTVQTNLNGLLPALHIKDTATQAKITAVVGLILSEVQSLAAIVPLVQPATSAVAMSRATEQVAKHPPLTANGFASSYNATMTAKTGNAELDRATAGLQIHVHGKLARWSSAGMLK